MQAGCEHARACCLFVPVIFMVFIRPACAVRVHSIVFSSTTWAISFPDVVIGSVRSPKHRHNRSPARVTAVSAASISALSPRPAREADPNTTRGLVSIGGRRDLV